MDGYFHAVFRNAASAARNECFEGDDVSAGVDVEMFWVFEGIVETVAKIPAISGSRCAVVGEVYEQGHTARERFATEKALDDQWGIDLDDVDLYGGIAADGARWGIVVGHQFDGVNS